MEIREPKVLDFLRVNRVAVLSVLLKDGSPHGASVHYSHRESPTGLFFFTERDSKKCEALLDGGVIPAAVVIGFSEGKSQTLQMRGTMRMVSDAEELAEVKKIYFEKIVEAKKYEADPDSVFLAFTPHWWRLTDYTVVPERIISSEAI